MTNHTALHGKGARLISILLAMAMLLTLLPAAAFARETGENRDYTVHGDNTVHVIVENTTFLTTTEDGTDPAWTDTLVDTYVELTETDRKSVV